MMVVKGKEGMCIEASTQIDPSDNMHKGIKLSLGGSGPMLRMANTRPFFLNNAILYIIAYILYI
jgi:hypothetical protein